MKLRKAAAQGDAQAQAELGFIYAHGIGVKQDHAEALNWFHKAAAQGHAGAEAFLGAMYCSGLGVGAGLHRGA